MKMVKGIYVLLTMFLLIGCATVMNPYKMDHRMHRARDDHAKGYIDTRKGF